ncbi:MAG: DUF2971 domain-containing protein [Flavobacterium psychrophilum]|nr:MAG: DUF2971 domain-containing protein [Flavobacterium psychrophilum]
MYRFRSIYNLLDGHSELENQEIYFSPSRDLNDPMEGLLDIFWDGDSVVWENLLRHFLMCLEHAFALNAIAGETTQIKAAQIPIFRNRSTYASEAAKKIHSQIEEIFFAYDYIKNLPDGLASRTNAIRRDELITYLRLVHAYALQAITSVYQEQGLLNGKTSRKTFTDLKNFIKGNDPLIEILTRAEGESSGTAELGSIFFSIAGKVSTELNLLTAFHDPTLSVNSNKFFLLYEFCEAYVSRIEEMVYPDWYTACFMSSCDNASVWSHYGEQHKGVCLKFKTDIVGNEIQFNIERIRGYNGSGPVVGTMPHTFYKVNYENKHVEIDFFRSLGRLQVFMLRSHWYTDRNGNLSVCADPISKDPEIWDRWHSSHWSSFYRGATTKLQDWSYENEYRLILTNMLHDFDTVENRKLKYDFNSLEGIIFGIKTTAEDKLKIIKIVDEKCKKYNRNDFNFYQAYYSKESGKIEYSLLGLIKQD